MPTFNEMKNDYIQKSFPLLAQLKNCEIIIVDSHSTDGTAELAKKYGFKLITVDTTSRARRLNIGIDHAQAPMILLHHPRSLLTLKGLQHLQEDKDLIWGAFTHQFDLKHYLLWFTSFNSNYLRGRLRGIFYLDHCIFAQKLLLEKSNKLPEIDIFEDTELCLRLRKLARPALIPFPAITSAIRFEKNGVWKQALRNQLLKFKYYFKADHTKMNQEYEKNLELNSKY